MGMSLSSLHLDAFAEAAKQKSFSAAAAKLHITQSALSQRVLNLEAELGSTLFIRESSGLRLTELGQRLLRYHQSKSLLEAEFMEALSAPSKEGLSGIVRVAAYSTVARSLVLPAMAELMAKNPGVNLEFNTAELRDLPERLFTGAADLILLDRTITKPEVECHLLGYEEYVMIQPTAKNARQDIYLDYDEQDKTTEDFLRLQPRKIPPYKRAFVGDIYGILDGVRLGLGKAVVPLHLLERAKGFTMPKGYEPMLVPVYLCYYAQAFFTDLQKAAISTMRDKIKGLSGPR